MFLNFLNKKKNTKTKSRYDFLINLKKFKKLKKKKKLIIGTTVGRSGMKWVLSILEAHDKIYGGGERNSTCESFHRYAVHNKLNIDQSALLNSIICETISDWKDNEISFQLSPYFSHSINLIDKFLKPDGYIWGINEFSFTVESFYNKGWYNPDYNISNFKKTPAFALTDNLKPSHFFGRIAPIDDINKKWSKLSRVGKISWYVNHTNKIIYNSLKKVNKKKKFLFVLKKADQNYDFYLKLAEWLNLKDKLTLKKFLSIKFNNTTKYFANENKKNKLNKVELQEMKTYQNKYNKIYNKIIKSINY
jgi:hypothetical protein